MLHMVCRSKLPFDEYLSKFLKNFEVQGIVKLIVSDKNIELPNASNYDWVKSCICSDARLERYIFKV